jgi:hypothetical protein
MDFEYRNIVKIENLENTTEPRPPVRLLKIEEEGDRKKGHVKSKIRLIGHWLGRWGFQPGHRVEVRYVASGLLLLRSRSASFAKGPAVLITVGS